MIRTPFASAAGAPEFQPPAGLATPVPLLVIAATMPAQWVPCPSKSRGSLSAPEQSSPAVQLEVSLTKSHPTTSSTKPLPSSSTPAAPLASA